MYNWAKLKQIHSRAKLGLCLILSWVLLGACQKAPQYPQLEQGIRVVRYLSAKSQLKRSSFPMVFPEGRPSDFVKWMFSTLGKAEWPPAEGSVELEPDMKQALSVTRTPILPRDLRLEANEPLSDSGRQIVVSGDDARWVIVVRGFLKPGEKPVLVREWAFPGKPVLQN